MERGQTDIADLWQGSLERSDPTNVRVTVRPSLRTHSEETRETVSGSAADRKSVV